MKVLLNKRITNVNQQVYKKFTYLKRLYLKLYQVGEDQPGLHAVGSVLYRPLSG